MTHIQLVLDGQELDVSYDKLVMAGYTGRNQAEVQAHIQELAEQGIPAPDTVPTLYACTPELLTTASGISVLGPDTAGEVEFVLIPHNGELLVGVGSDHTDRKMEETDIPRAKQLCGKVVSREVWRLSDLLDDWDGMELRSWTGEPDQETLYQQGTLAGMMTPDAILEHLRQNSSASIEHAIVFSGTLTVLTGHFQPSTRFTVELHDPARDRSLRCLYQVQVMDYVNADSAQSHQNK